MKAGTMNTFFVAIRSLNDWLSAILSQADCDSCGLAGFAVSELPATSPIRSPSSRMRYEPGGSRWLRNPYRDLNDSLLPCVKSKVTIRNPATRRVRDTSPALLLLLTGGDRPRKKKQGGAARDVSTMKRSLGWRTQPLLRPSR